MKRPLILALALPLIYSLLAAAQDAEIGRRIYSTNAPSVLLLYVQSPDGQYIAQGSGFLIEGSRIVTNAHVANGGKVFVELGLARVPAKVEKIDSRNDLAVLSVAVEMTAKPLTLANVKPSPGDLVFAITNPEGLERTISQGVISANRELGGRRLLQISTPISHGSSGGPIFNRDGHVVGVAVGMLADGQNLNFAVPIELLKELLSQGPPTKLDLGSLAEEVRSLQVEQSGEKYSNDPNSGYQKKQNELETFLNQGVAIAGRDPEALLKVAELSENIAVDIAISAVQRAVEARASPDAYLLLANVLHAKYAWSSGDEQKDLMKQAETAARMAIRQSRVPTAEMYFRLGDTLEDEGQYADADHTLRTVLSVLRSDTTSQLYFDSVRDLMLCAGGLSNLSDEKRWFGELKKGNNANAYDWNYHAKQLVSANEFKNAGDAYSRAADVIKHAWCDAGTSYQSASEADSALYANRKCIETLTGTTGSERDLAWAHAFIAGTLNSRGVYSEALNHAKEATVLDSSNAWAFTDEAEALNNLQRFTEAINASKEAIRLSDGKYASMHFTLGTSYFKTENWELARQSYEKAAELDTTDDAAAYNVAVCLARQSYFNDAAHWYEEALRRNPKRNDADDLRQRIKTLRR
jgi:tetratricopeptide (TPR) repeat protein